MKTNTKRIIAGFLFLAFCISCQIEKCIKYNFADVNDYKIFPARTSQASIVKFQFPHSRSFDLRLPQFVLADEKKVPFDDFLKSKSVVAFLIIHNDTMLYENYFNDYKASSQVPVFSIAKSITATLVGCAIDDGYIQSTEDEITKYLPNLKQEGFDKIKIKDLLQMTSGIDFKENFMAITNGVPAYYYGKNLRKKIARLKLQSEPGTKFEYKSADTQLLGLLLEKAIKPKTITQYLEERIWQPLGMEYDATWSLDQKKNGIEKTFCCLNTRARDLAKIGRLYLNKGNWNGRQIISENWIDECTMLDSCDDHSKVYQNSWWVSPHKGYYFSRGYLGQYIYINPEKKLIIVRLGEKSAGVDWLNVFSTIAGKF